MKSLSVRVSPLNHKDLRACVKGHEKPFGKMSVAIFYLNLWWEKYTKYKQNNANMTKMDEIKKAAKSDHGYAEIGVC